MPRARKPGHMQFTLACHESNLQCMRQSLAEDMQRLVRLMSAVVHQQDAINLLQKRIDYAKAHNVTHLPLTITTAERAAINVDET